MDIDPFDLPKSPSLSTKIQEVLFCSSDERVLEQHIQKIQMYKIVRENSLYFFIKVPYYERQSVEWFNNIVILTLRNDTNYIYENI